MPPFSIFSPMSIIIGGGVISAILLVIGIVVSKLDAVHVARYTGDIPQNVNFAIKHSVAKTFLETSRVAFSTTALFSTGSTPGNPQQTGQILVFGGSIHESALHEQNTMVVVLSWICVSRPMITSYSVMLPSSGDCLSIYTEIVLRVFICEASPRK